MFVYTFALLQYNLLSTKDELTKGGNFIVVHSVNCYVVFHFLMFFF